MTGNSAPVADESMLRQEVDRLKADLQCLKVDFAELASDAAGASKSAAEDAGNRIAQKAKSAAARGTEALEAVEQEIASHPFMSLAAALAVGVMLGIGLSRKD